MSLPLIEPITQAPAARDDERLRRMLAHRLRTAGYPELRKLRVTVRDGTIGLHGEVSSYYLKQLAQEVVRRFDRNTELKNAVRVTR
jgi:hypothetical protein